MLFAAAVSGSRLRNKKIKSLALFLSLTPLHSFAIITVKTNNTRT